MANYGGKLLLALTAMLVARGADAADPLPIAVLNIDRIFKTHKPFLDKLEPIKQSVQELEKTVQLRGVELETVANQLRKTQPGTPDFARLQQQAAKLNNDLQRFVAEQRGELQKRETSVYVIFYREVEEEVSKYAKAHSIKLVIRQQENSLDPNQPVAETLKALNRPIIYEEGLDITGEILKALEARHSAGSKP